MTLRDPERRAQCTGASGPASNRLELLRRLEAEVHMASEAERPGKQVELAWALRNVDPRRALELLPHEADAGGELAARALVTRAACLRRRFEFEAAAEAAEQGLARARDLGMGEWTARAREVLAEFAYQRGDLERASDLLDGADRVPDLEGETRLELGLARLRLETHHGRFARALEIAAELREGLESLASGCAGRVALCEGSVLFEMGDAQAALARYREALPLLRGGELRYWVALAHYNSAVVLLAVGALEEAADEGATCMELARASGEDPIRMLALLVTTEVHLRRGELDPALAGAEEGLAGRCTGLEREILWRLLGKVRLARGEEHLAEEAFQRALESSRAAQRPHRGHELRSRIGIARSRLQAGRVPEASEALDGALEAAREWGSEELEAELHEVLARIAEAAGDLAGALAHTRSHHTLTLALHTRRSESQVRNLRVLHEIEAARSRELTLEESRARLEQEVRERTEQLEEALATLRQESAERLQSQREGERLLHELRQSQKMESLGRLAGGLAHDFNNLLTVIQGYSELLLEQLPREGALHVAAAEIAGAAARAGELTSRLLAFSRKRTSPPVPTDPSLALFELRRMLGRLLGEDVRLEIEADPRAGIVCIDPVQLEQVVVNLAVNARDAMPEGGTLSIRTRRIDLPDPEHAVELGAGPHVLLEVTDTGTGMAPEVLEHIFEPFFTTKGPERGTGLGLSTTSGIVRQGGGELTVSSEPGRGTRFRIYLPAVRGEEPRAALPAAEPVRASGPSARVLLVEDDPGLRRLVSEGLRQRGLEVLEAGSGAEALQVFRGSRPRPELVVSDLVMPGMGGDRLLEALRLEAPELPFVLVSGYPERLEERGRMGLPHVLCLAKPFTIAALHALVAGALEGSRS